MRHTHRCPKCAHDEVIHVPELRDSDHDRLVVGLSDTFFSGHVGTFEAYICRACGFTELYANEIGKIDPAKLQNATILKAAPGTPFR